MTEQKKNLELKKHVATIHSSNKLSLLQRKIANALLFNAYEDLLEKEEHVIHIRDLCELVGYSSNDYKTIKKSLVNLLSTVIEWNLIDGNKVDSNGVWNASSIISDASIDGPICTYSYSNKMKKLLYHPELYGRLNMAVQAQFQSSYGLALYENCIRYQNIGQTPWLDIVKFRRLMGVEDGKYKIFRDFKARVLDTAIAEVNKYSPITLEPCLRKQNRQVVAIQFLIKKSAQQYSIELEQPPIELSALLKEKFGLSKKQITDMLSAYSEEYIQQKISLIETSQSYVNGKIKNLAKYLISAITDDYQATKSNAPKEKVNLESYFDHKKQKEIDQTNTEKYRRYQNKQIVENFGKIAKNEQNKLLSEFEKFLGVKSIYANIYHREGLANPLIQDQLCNFIKQKQHKLLEKIMSYDDYLNAEVVE